MDGAREVRGAGTVDFHVESFNPCFDGWCSGRKDLSQHDGFSGMVSILVLMDGAREEIFGLFLAEKTYVSILVLMDGAREGCSPFITCKFFKCFNPCFDGWCSGSRVFLDPVGQVKGFNPCFDGWCSGRSVGRSMLPTPFCFNPCSVGSCSGRSGTECEKK